MPPGENPTSDKGEPYSWDEQDQPSQETRRLWQEVAAGLDKNQTVVWKNAVDSLDQAHRHLNTSEEARRFVETYMKSVISILLEQQPQKIGQLERSCVEDSLDRAILIIADDIQIQHVRKGESKVLEVLAMVFNRKKTYYKGSKANWNASLSGCPEVRIHMIERFRQERGFARLAEYLSARASSPTFPSLDLIHLILSAISESVPNRTPGADQGSNTKDIEKDAILVSRAVMDYIGKANDETLKKLPHDGLNTVRYDLQRIFDRLISTHRKSTYAFYDFWRELTLKLITSQSLPLKLFGWEQVSDLIQASAEHRPPPRAFLVSGAGCSFVNGPYAFNGTPTPEGYVQLGAEISYRRRVPDTVNEGAGKTLTLFRCTMRSQQKWWFLSEADEEQPGTDKDIDYYQHKSKQHEEKEPPPRGWVTCRNAGVDPAPRLKGRGLMVPAGEEYNTLEHQLARWAIENQILMLVLGDSIHREVVARSTPLIKFLASMCERDGPLEHKKVSQRPNAYCLQTRHLLLAWKTCTSKTDAAVSDEVYQLLVSILPSLPDNLAIPLLEAIQGSLKERREKRSHLFEVAQFCTALASANPVDPKTATGNGGEGPQGLSTEVRAEVLQLLWAVLTHPDASSLKSYENLKRYVTSELRVEPKGSAHREAFLESCRRALLKNAQLQGGGDLVDEALALRMVKLTVFLLEACPRAQAVQLVSIDQGELPAMLFNELTAYLMRRKHPTPLPRKSSSVHSADFTEDHPDALSERLRILRYVFGLSEQVKMSGAQLTHLWKLASVPSDREALMVFVADGASSKASGAPPGHGIPEPPALVNQQNLAPTAHPPQVIAAAFSDDTRSYAFQELFCSASVNWHELGENAFRSFQIMFVSLRQEASAPSSHAVDALWRICLVAGNDNVASQAMKDLLALYVSMAEANRTAWPEDRDQMQTDGTSENFGDRVFNVLVDVKKGLEKGDPSAERSAERCLRILNSAVGDGSGVRSVTPASLSSFSSMSVDGNLSEALKSLPHGMRSQSCYRRIGIMAKRTSAPNHAGPTAVSAQGPRGREESATSGASGPTSSRHSNTMRFSLDVHPLETLGSVKAKVAAHCKCPVANVKPISVSGRLGGTRSAGQDSSQMSLNVVPDDSLVDQLGIAHGCEMVFVIAGSQVAQNASVAPGKPSPKKNTTLEISEIFHHGPNGSADRLFETLLAVLESLPDPSTLGVDTQKHVWDLLLAMPTNVGIAKKVRSTAEMGSTPVTAQAEGDAMVVDTPPELWTRLLDQRSFHHSVYVMQVIDSFLQPAPEVLCVLPPEERKVLEKAMQVDAVSFRRGFINSGGFDAVVRFFSTVGRGYGQQKGKARMGNAVALRILKCCLFGNSLFGRTEIHSSGGLDQAGYQLLNSLKDRDALLKSLTSMVVEDEGISSSAIADVLKLLRLLFHSTRATEAFISLPNGMAERFLMTLLLWEGGPEATRTNSAISAASKIRKSTHDLILSTPGLATRSLPWLISAMDEGVEVTSDSTSDYFAVLRKLVQSEDGSKSPAKASPSHLRDLGTAVCKKLASCPRPTNDSALIDFSTGVLCGCLKLLRALIENGGGAALRPGTALLLQNLSVKRWSEGQLPSKGLLERMTSSFRSRLRPEDQTLIDLMGAIFDGFLSPGGSSSVVSICCDKESRQLGFDVVAAAARSSTGNDGYYALVSRIYNVIVSAAPYLRHRWGHNGGTDDGHNRTLRNTSKYSGLRNQGCTCYMNSVLQQMFMMPGLRKNICAAGIPSSLRTSGGGMFLKGGELVGKKIALQWDTGVSYDAMVEAFDENTGMHTIRYCPMQVATVGGQAHQQVHPDDIARLPPEMSDEFFLSEGRPGKETGVFEVVQSGPQGSGDSTRDSAGENSSESRMKSSAGGIEENEDEAASRHLLEEVQRTFIHLDEGSRGRCFDPRAFVEACNCLKLEFDVWQQNDASEFAMKLLDRLEISLKRWAPSNFRYLEHTFGLKQTKQKLCKECGLKTNREENLMSIDCQIRGKTDIHEALSSMCEVEYMEGDNRVFCDRCKKNTDTVLRTAISALPDMLILSLKRFDLDYNTFETVKLNSRCAFGQTLNMKRYTLEGVDAAEKANVDSNAMDTDDDGDDEMNDPLSSLPDDDYEYKLAGVLVHAGVAQGGHYYSFIRDRSNPSSENEPDKWYRFDDEDVTPFDPSSIEVECFGGKVKKETKFPTGQVHTVESEQFANALMVFYEKVKPAEHPAETEKDKENGSAKRFLADRKVSKTNGYDVFEPDVRRSNATHRWQTFLFDAEFQSFLKGLLGLCLIRAENDRMELSQSGSSSLSTSSGEADGSWRTAVVQMLLSFVYDILLYSSDKGSLDEWVKKLSKAMISDRESAMAFLVQLARKTHTGSGNWLRTYLADCPEPDSRVAAGKIICAAIRSCASIESEQTLLRKWSKAWHDQLAKQHKMPTKLEGDFQSLEDVNALRGGGASVIGIIISYLTALLEVAPRTWRYNSDLCLFIRDLCSSGPEFGGTLLRDAMVEAQIPARLICLIIRDRAAPHLRAAFPGASASHEAIETQVRSETNPTSHIMPVSGGQMMNVNDLNSRGSAGGAPVASDYLTTFEALGCFLEIEGVKQADLVVESEESSRGRHRVALTDAAAEALRQVFRETTEPNAPGMGRYDIEAYLQVCGVDSSTLPPQRIVEILAKYQTGDGNGTKGSNYLSVEGFLAYYRDTAQTNEARVRSDLHTFGFRPDLTRRSREARIFMAQGREQHLQTVESVAADVAATLKSTGPVKLGRLADLGFDSFHLYACAYSSSEILAEHILSAAAYEKDTTHLIVGTLKALNRAPTGWAGNETWSAAIMVLKVLAAVPDSRQQERISMIMQCTEKPPGFLTEHGLGLLMAAKAFYGTRPTQHYSSDLHFSFDRYMTVIKEIYKLRAGNMWMSEHRQLWSWMERELISSGEEVPLSHQLRNDLPGRREDTITTPLDHHHSDSDMPGIDGSEEDGSEYSQNEEMDFIGSGKVVVNGAGLGIVNGTYVHSGTFDRVGKYVKAGYWKERKEDFSLFRCHVSDNTRRWYISIVPKNVQPGTNTDIDFYSAPVVNDRVDTPPEGGWAKAGEGLDPPPVVVWKEDPEAEVPVHWNSTPDGGGGGDGNPNGGGRTFI